MAALVGVDARTRGIDPPSSPAALSAYLLHRERQGWAELLEGGRITSTARRIGHASLVAALTGGLPYEQGIDVVQVTGIAVSTVDADQPFNHHQVAYPTVEPETVLASLAPDRLAEDYVGLTIPDPGATEQADLDLADPWAVPALTKMLKPPTPNPGNPAMSGASLRSVMTVLVAAAGRWPHLSSTLVWPLIQAHPALVLAGGAATLTALASLAESDANLLDVVYKELPAGSHLEFDQAAMFVAELRAELVRREGTRPARRADVLAALGYRT